MGTWRTSLSSQKIDSYSLLEKCQMGICNPVHPENIDLVQVLNSFFNPPLTSGKLCVTPKTKNNAMRRKRVKVQSLLIQANWPLIIDLNLYIIMMRKTLTSIRMKLEII